MPYSVRFSRGERREKGVEAGGKILRSWKGEPFMIYDFIRFGANGNGQWSDGTLAPHAFFTPCSEIGVCVEQSAKDPIFTSDRVFALDGEWKIAYVDENIKRVDTDNAAFFDATLPFRSESETKKAFIAEKTFSVYDAKKSYLLDISGADGDFEVYLNGAYVGATKLGYGEFDVSKFVQKGENVLLVFLSENADERYLRSKNVLVSLGSVTLVTRGDGYLTDYNVSSKVDGVLQEATLGLSFGGNADRVVVSFSDGDKILAEPQETIVDGEATVTLKGDLTVYSDETPYLYDAYIRVFVKDKETECTHVRFAVGMPETKGKDVLFSGEKVKLYGVKYDYSDRFEDELAIIKSFNMNTVKVDEILPGAFYEKCAEIGVFVVQGVPCDFVEPGKKKKNKDSDDVLSDYLLTVTADVYNKTKAYPSVVMYAFDNVPEGNFKENGVKSFAEECGKPVLGVSVVKGALATASDLPVIAFMDATDVKLDRLNDVLPSVCGVVTDAFRDGEKKGVFDENDVAKDEAVLLKYAFRPFRTELLDNRTIRISSRRAFATSQGVKVTVSAVTGIKEKLVAEFQPVLKAGETRDFSIYIGEYGEQTKLRVKFETASGAHIATETLRVKDEKIKPEEIAALKVKNYVYTVKNTSFNLKNIEENVFEKRSFFAPCSSEYVAKIGKYADAKKNSDRVYTLSGEWDFALFEEDAPQSFSASDLKDTITLPSSWESAGKKPLCYLSDYPFKYNLTDFKIDDKKGEKNAVGVYRKVINVGDTAFGYILSFEKVSGSLELQINGKYVGYTQLNRGEFDITNFVAVGENEIVAIVKEYVPTSFLQGSKGFKESGIIGDVNLIKYRLGGLKKYDVLVKRVGAEFAADITLDFFNGAADEYVVEIQKDDKTLYEGSYAKAEQIKVALQGGFEAYNDETPVLYDVFVKTVEKDFVTECVRFPLGFNSMETMGDTVYYNGAPLKLRGVAYNPTFNEFGKLLGAEDVKRDLLLIKNYGFNAVRPTHPPKEEFYAAALELGLFVIEDSGINTAFAGGKKEKKRNAVMNESDFVGAVKEKIFASAMRTKNYCNVVAYFIAEDGNTTCGKEGLKTYKENVSRPVFCYGQNVGDGLCKSLPAVNDAVDMINVAINKNPVFFPEYALGKGVGCATMNEYEEIISSVSCCLGGCVAYFTDDVCETVSGEANGIFSELRYPYPGAEAIRYIYRPLVSKPTADYAAIEIKNTRAFATAYKSVYLTVIINGATVSRTKLNVTVPPLSTKKYDMFVGHIEGDMLLNVEYRDRETDELSYTEQHRLNVGVRKFDTKDADKPLTVTELFDYVDFTFDCGNVRFDKRIGGVTKYSLMGKDVMKADSVIGGANCLVTNTYRPFTRNLNKPFAPMTSKVKSFKYEMLTGEEAAVRIESVLSKGRKETYIVQDEYIVKANGVISVSSVLNPLKKDASLMDCFGKQLRLNNTFGNVLYYGNGPSDNYIDMCEHACVGIYGLNVDKTFEGYSVLQECGNRTNVRYAIVRNNDGEGVLIATKGAPFQLRVSPFSDKEIALSGKTNERPKQSGVYVDINAFVSGIGTSEDGYPMPKYVVKAGEHILKFDIIPVQSLR